MRARRLLVLSVWLVIGCEKGPVAPKPEVGVARIPPPPSATETATPAPELPPEPPSLAMYPVGKIYSLLDVRATEGGLELRLGEDPGGGSGLQRNFRYVPLVNGVPDFAAETSEVGRASTTANFDELAGKRPRLVLHSVGGFRSATTEGYQILGENNRFVALNIPDLPGIGEGIFPWTKDRLLEFRGPQPELAAAASMEARLPRLRVLDGADKAAPQLPAKLEKRLKSEGFSLATFTVLKTGEVLAIGYLTSAGGFGTVLWSDDLKQPVYFVTAAEGLGQTEDLLILGGKTPAEVRLRVLRQIYRLDGASWTVESTVPPGGLPDVWFGAPLVLPNETDVAQPPDGVTPLCPSPMFCEAFARLAKGAPWLPIPIHVSQEMARIYPVDAEGTIWTVEDETLLASKKHDAPFEVTEEALVTIRKQSILRGGSEDPIGGPPDHFTPKTCRMHYVLLDKSAAAKAPSDFPKIRAALKGHTELAGARFIVSRERDWQFFGAQIKDEALADKLASLVGKQATGVRVLCAEPVPTRDVKIDLPTGALLP